MGFLPKNLLNETKYGYSGNTNFIFRERSFIVEIGVHTIRDIHTIF